MCLLLECLQRRGKPRWRWKGPRLTSVDDLKKKKTANGRGRERETGLGSGVETRSRGISWLVYKGTEERAREVAGGRRPREGTLNGKAGGNLTGDFASLTTTDSVFLFLRTDLRQVGTPFYRTKRHGIYLKARLCWPKGSRIPDIYTFKKIVSNMKKEEPEKIQNDDFTVSL